MEQKTFSWDDFSTELPKVWRIFACNACGTEASPNFMPKAKAENEKHTRFCHTCNKGLVPHHEVPQQPP